MEIMPGKCKDVDEWLMASGEITDFNGVKDLKDFLQKHNAEEKASQNEK